MQKVVGNETKILKRKWPKFTVRCVTFPIPTFTKIVFLPVISCRNGRNGGHLSSQGLFRTEGFVGGFA